MGRGLEWLGEAMAVGMAGRLGWPGTGTGGIWVPVSRRRIAVVFGIFGVARGRGK
jgi:hypothetical protein